MSLVWLPQVVMSQTCVKCCCNVFIVGCMQFPLNTFNAKNEYLISSDLQVKIMSNVPNVCVPTCQLESDHAARSDITLVLSFPSVLAAPMTGGKQTTKTHMSIFQKVSNSMIVR